MKYTNLAIRKKIAKSGVTQVRLAEKLGIHHVTLTHWLNEDLNDERRKDIEKALEELKVVK